MAARQGPLNRREGAPSDVSYSQIMPNENPKTGTKRLTFKMPLDMHAQLLAEGTFKDREMDIDLAKEKAPANVSSPWVLGKFIPQAP